VFFLPVQPLFLAERGVALRGRFDWKRSAVRALSLRIVISEVENRRDRSFTTTRPSRSSNSRILRRRSSLSMVSVPKTGWFRFVSFPYLF
jgi:hypothetical protein